MQSQSDISLLCHHKVYHMILHHITLHFRFLSYSCCFLFYLDVLTALLNLSYLYMFMSILNKSRYNILHSGRYRDLTLQESHHTDHKNKHLNNQNRTLSGLQDCQRSSINVLVLVLVLAQHLKSQKLQSVLGG